MKRKILLTAVALLCAVGMRAAADFASATYSDPYSITISNSTFDTEVTTGWTASVFEWHSPGIAEVYDKKTQNCSIKRSISNLKAGHYQFSASALARGNINSEKVYLYIGDKKQYIFAESFSTYTIDYDLAADGSVEIGLRCDANYVPIWVALDNVELKYYGSTDDYNDYIALRKVSSLDLTWTVQSADFSTGNGGWVVTGTSVGNQQSGSGAMESWNNNNVTISQTIAVPNGKYRVTVDMISGNDTKQAYLFASSGDNTVNSSVVTAQSGSGRDNYANMCEDVAGNTLTIDNFSVTNGSITIGVKDPSNGGWIVFDNFTLKRIADSDGTDMTSYLVNAAVNSTDGWTNVSTGSGEQYTDAPDNTYLDNNSGEKNMYQDVNLPAGYYLLKCATRASSTANANVYVYSYSTKANLGQIANHTEGNSGNLLDRGWAWTYVPFTLTTATKVGIGFYSNCSSTWAGADDFHLTYYTSELEMKRGHLAQVVADATAWADKVETTPALETALAASAPSCSTVEACNTAISDLTTTIANARAAEAPYADFTRVKNGANGIKDVAYTQKAEGAYSTFTETISTQTTAANNAITATAVNTAISTLKSAIKTYIASAEPKNEGEYFDITCLMANPDFSTGDATGWTYANAPNVNWSNCEYYQTEFDIYQTVTGLPTGSYSLNVQAYQRPGEAGAVYNDYIGGTDNASSVLYINSITSRVKNIAADAQTTYKLSDGSNFDWPNDSRVGTEGSYRYLPNSQQGAKLYFDAGLYDATCAAVVEEGDGGSLTLGFKSTQDHVALDWTIFDNFRLRYYGSSLLIYYKQYLPQLKDEAQADLDNATYSIVQGKERPDLTTAIAATPAAETEIAYKAVIDDILEKQAAFQSAKSSYEALDEAKEYAALTEITTNIGDGVFKYPSNTPTLWSTYSSAKSAVDDYTVSNVSTAAEVQNMVDALDDAIEAYENITWTTPSSTTRYKLTLAGKGTLTYQTAATDGGYGMPFTPAADYKAQTFFLTPTSGESNYIMSFVDFDGNTRYICDGLASGYTAGTGHYGIRTTTIAEDALSIHIELSTTDDVLYMFNTNVIVDENWKKLGSNGGDFYTDDTYSNWSITEASQASVELSIGAGKLATRIFPFTPTLPEGVETYACDSKKSDTYLSLVKVDVPVANTPYILYSEETVASTDITGWGTATEDSYTSGYLTGVFARTEVPQGCYVLQTQNNKQAFYKVDQTGAYSSPYRVYVTVPSSVKMFNFTFEDIETAIEAARSEGENAVTLHYNVSGQQIQNAQKGLNIIKMSDGSVRKILVK